VLRSLQERLEDILTKQCKAKSSALEKAKTAEIEAEIVSDLHSCLARTQAHAASRTFHLVKGPLHPLRVTCRHSAGIE
jgi:hypothetical protein